MSFVDRITVDAAEKVRASLGPRAGLRALLPLTRSLVDDDARARAVLAALECLAELNEPAEWVGTGASLVALWPAVTPSASPIARLTRVCAQLARHGETDAAVALATAEVRRSDDARAHYLLARCRDPAPDAGVHYLAALRRAERPPTRHALADRIRARLLRWVATEGPLLRRAPEAPATSVDRSAILAREATRVDAARPPGAEALPQTDAPAEAASPAEVLAVAAAHLGRRSRYGRVAALDQLALLATRDASDDDEPPRPPDPIAVAARRLAARHADRRGRALTAIEADRIHTVLRTSSDPRSRARAIRRVDTRIALAAPTPPEQHSALLHAIRDDEDDRAADILRRATAVLTAATAGPRPAADAGDGLIAWLALESIARIRRGEGPAANALLDELRERAERTDAWPIATLAACRCALADDATWTRGRTLAALLVTRPLDGPTHGWVALASALEARDADSLAPAALRRGMADAEPGADEALWTRLRDAAWTAYQRGEARAAESLLREAKSIATRTGQAKGSSPQEV